MAQKSVITIEDITRYRAHYGLAPQSVSQASYPCQ